MAVAIGSASSVGAVKITSVLSEEIAFLRFLGNRTGHISLRMEKHMAVTIKMGRCHSWTTYRYFVRRLLGRLHGFGKYQCEGVLGSC